MLRSVKTMRTCPDMDVYRRAMAARRSTLHVIAETTETNPSTGLTEDYISNGSSFVIKNNSQDSIALTCAHVVGTAVNVLVRRMLGGSVQEFHATVIYVEHTMDVAILRVHGLTTVRPLMFAPRDAIAGMPIAAVGYCDPDNLFDDSYTRIPAILPGHIKGAATHQMTQNLSLQLLALSCAGMKGMSGGPIMSKKGFVGLTKSGEVGTTYAVHIMSIIEVLKMFASIHPQDVMTIDELIAQIG